LEAAEKNFKTGVREQQTRNCTYQYSIECDLVDDLILNQQCASQTHQSILEISRNTSVVSWSLHP